MPEQSKGGNEVAQRAPVLLLSLVNTAAE